MIERRIVEGAPKAIAPYVHVVRAGGFVFITGQMPIDPATGEYVRGDIKSQTVRVLENLRIVLDSCGLDYCAVVQARAYLTDMRDYDGFNEAYEAFLGKTLPARTCVSVTGLAGGADVEIDLVAFDGNDNK